MRLIGLYTEDKMPRKRDMRAGRNRRGGAAKIRTPKLCKIQYDPYGITADVRLVPNVKLRDFAERAETLSNEWEMVRVSVQPIEPNRIRVRAVRRDPLIERHDFVPTGKPPADLRYYPAGFDGFGDQARIRLHNGSGVAISGLPNSGKTSFILGMLSWLAPSDSVVFLIADGKTTTGCEGDYLDIAPRAVSVIGNDPARFNGWIKQIERIRAMRAATIRQSLGVRNFWDVGPTPEWPLIVPVVDECHMFFEQVKAGGDYEMEFRNSTVASNAYTCANITRLGRNVGILPFYLTQKSIAESIPTIINHNCHAHLCFQVQTDEAAVASLGKEIRKYPEVHPANFQSEEFIGVATMAAEGRRGFVQVRTPYCSAEQTAAVADQTVHLVRPEVCPGLDIGLDHHALLAADDMTALLAGGYREE
jgi:S-DNA-T family DNA segregation ATPase FtsK/SpoIIIE